MRKLTTIAALLLLTGCYTQKKAEKQLFKAYTHYEPTVAKYANIWYPVRESIRDSVVRIPGKSITIPGRTIYINCDSVIKSSDVSHSKIPVECPPVNCPAADTLLHYQVKIQESTSAIAQLNASLQNSIDTIQKLRVDIAVKNAKISDCDKKLRVRTIWMIGVLVAAGAIVVIKLIRFLKIV